jgi:hypothetical protein
MDVKTSKAIIEELKDELNQILPHGQECNTQTIQDMSQFLDAYLTKMRGIMIEKYPHNEEKIRETYDHVMFDNKNETLFC